MNSVRSITKALSLALLVSVSAASAMETGKQLIKGAVSKVVRNPGKSAVAATGVAALTYSDVRNGVRNAGYQTLTSAGNLISTHPYASIVAATTVATAAAITAGTFIYKNQADIKAKAETFGQWIKNSTLGKAVAAHPYRTAAIATSAVATMASAVYFRSPITNAVCKACSWMVSKLSAKKAVEKAVEGAEVVAQPGRLQVATDVAIAAGKAAGKFAKEHKVLVATPVVAVAPAAVAKGAEFFSKKPAPAPAQ